MEGKLPFPLEKTKTFYQQLSDWISDIFYDVFPKHGLDIRDEQIYMAFQLGRAFKEKNVIFAEAGVGTGKTLVYLLYTIAYARYTGKPALICCADDYLIEQLMKPNGEIEKLNRALNLDVDARLAKPAEHFLCLRRLDALKFEEAYSEVYTKIRSSLPDYAYEKKGMQQFKPYGDRKEFPELSDEEWNEMNWDPYQDCMTCSKRQRCGLTITRDHYRKSTDLMICSHDYFMEHIWSKDARKREGQLPLLPDHSCIVFDEGHLLEYAAQKALTYRLKKSKFPYLCSCLSQYDIRESFALLIEDALESHEAFFDQMINASYVVEGSNKLEIKRTDILLRKGSAFYERLVELTNELVIEHELHTIHGYDQYIVDEHLDAIEQLLRLFLEDQQSIHWLEEHQEEWSFVLMPKMVNHILKEHVFHEQKPMIFSSATLAENGSFEYISASLGIERYLSFQVNSPFDYASQMKANLFIFSSDSEQKDTDQLRSSKKQHLIKKLKETGGRMLILIPHEEELEWLKNELRKESFPFSLLFEGDQERSDMVLNFQRDETSVLFTCRLWEGLDVPGPSLSHVVIWDLPYPPNDPVFKAKRRGFSDPYESVDLPYMLLRLRQGIGRLIRTSTDRGTVSIYVAQHEWNPLLQERVQGILPQTVMLHP